jgi:regulator of protease activity HflC (stomatin/prohibitin superfamily)
MEALLSSGVSLEQETKNMMVHEKEVAQAEDTPAYAVLQQYKLLDASYRKEHFDDIFDSSDDLTANSSRADNIRKRFKWGVYWTPGCGFILYRIFNTEVVVPPGHVCRFIDNDNQYLLARPGIHNITDPFLQQVGFPVPVQKQVIEHGNRTIVTVPQGKLGYATDMGQPVLLPPGLHSWTSETLRYERTFGLDEHVIEIGPYTVLTVDEGYSAITQNNGLQVVLDGGHTHLLTHQKWRFEKFITLKIQTDDLERIRAASADNVIMEVNSTVVWRIKDVRVAATMAAETMAHGHEGTVSADITKLRRDVLKQAIASLAGFIGSVNYSDSFHVAAAAQRNIETAAEVVAVGDSPTEPVEERETGRQSNSTDNPIFDSVGMSEAVSHANQLTSNFGVEILSINIISANPVDDNLTASLATGAVASAEALQAETQARGMAKAMKIQAEAMAVTRKIDADSQAMATLVKARADGEAETLRAEGAKAAEILRAEGSRQAAALIEGSTVAVSLETLKTSASAIKKNDKFFFGQEPGYMANVLMRGPNENTRDDESGEYLVTSFPEAAGRDPRNLD